MIDNVIKEESVSFRDGFRGIWRHARRFRATIGLIGFLGVISAIANGFVPYVTGRFFDALIALSQGDSHATGLPYWMLLLALWALIRIISDCVDWWMDRRRRWLNSYLHTSTQAESFIHLLQLPLSFHTEEHLNAVFSRINSAAWRMTSITDTVVQVSPQLLSIVIGITLAFSINATLAGILAIGVVLYAIALMILLRGTADVDIQAHQKWNDSWDDASSAVSQALAVKQATAERYEVERIKKSMSVTVAALWYKMN